MRNAWVNTALIAVGGLGWLFTLQPTPSPFVLVHYGLSIAALAGIVRACAGKWEAYRKWIRIAAAALAICLVILYGQHDSYEDRWTNQQGTKYIDTYHRWGGELVERCVFLAAGGIAHGPMAGEEP